jgi:hypothetical protein
MIIARYHSSAKISELGSNIPLLDYTPYLSPRWTWFQQYSVADIRNDAKRGNEPASCRIKLAIGVSVDNYQTLRTHVFNLDRFNFNAASCAALVMA